MRVNRRFLYWGIFLVAVGGVVVAADIRTDGVTTIADALRLWPLAFIAVGLGLALRRTRFSLPAGLLAAAIPGLVLGGSFAVAPRLAVDCGGGGSAASVATHQGTFDGPARVTVTTGCGTLVVGTAPGSAWRFDAGNTADRTPTVGASTQALTIDAGGDHGWLAFDGRDAWQLTLPTSPIDSLTLIVNAGDGRIGLPGAHVENLDITANAAQTTVDVSAASVANVSGTVNAGLLSFHLSANVDTVGSFAVNAGELQVCAPSGLGLRIHHAGVLSGIRVSGLQPASADWTSPDYGSAAHRADLSVNVNLGGVEINPIGGCR